MAEHFRYDFLKLEFRPLYDEIQEEINKAASMDTVFGIQNILISLVACIYNSNKIYQNKELAFNERLKELNDINLLEGNIEKKILSLYENKEVAEPEVVLYEILVWLAITYGCEDYSLILQSLNDREKDIFAQELKRKKKLKNIDGMRASDENEEERKKEAANLVEEGEKYYFGRNCTRDNKKALEYFLKAAEYDDEFAQAYIGLFYDKGYAVGRNYNRAAKWYYKAAIKGNAFSQNALGTLYLEGKGVSKCYEKAFLWFQKSAESEYPAAYYQIGRMYYNGFGVEKDLAKSFSWYEKAAEANLPVAQHALSYMYKNGEGCEQNNIRAYFWMEKAAENNYEDAFYIIGKSYLDGIYLEKNYQKAFYYLKKGYGELDLNCIYELANMYFNGYYVEKDIMTALELYNLCLEYGNTDLYYRIGKIYEELEMTEKAVDIYLEGHNKGIIKCTQRLGIMLYNGEGVTRDLDKAIEFMEKAADEKAPHAMYVLAISYIRQNTFKDKTMEKAVELLKESYALGCAYAAEYLAAILINELKEGKQVNSEELLEYIQFGSENNIINSYFQYGFIYEKGIAVEKDYEQSYHYYKLAADNKLAKAMYKLGIWYERGIFLSQNIESAIKWFQQAAELNDSLSIEKLIEIYEKGFGGKEDHMKAIYYLFKLIELDSLKGKCKLAYYCFKGIGIEIDTDRGNELIQEVEEIDKGTANNLKGFLGSENLLDLSKDQIIDYYKEGIDLGNAECYGNLASFLYNNELYNDERYTDDFKLAMEGIDISDNQCIYYYLLSILKKIQASTIITLEEIAVINKIKELVDQGFYTGIKTLEKWYETRNVNDLESLYKYKQQAIFYNLNS